MVIKDDWNDFNFLNLPRLDLWPRMCFILEKVLCALEKKGEVDCFGVKRPIDVN